MKIVLAGSPQISVNAFRKVIENFDVVAVVTQPDRQKGRGMHMEETPVAKLATEFNIKCFKPEKISEIKEDLEALDFDLFLTFAFGQYIPTSVLKIGKRKPLNIHGSLLPKYRGAAPIHYAILNGDNEIGITLMEMVKEMDAGDMWFKASRPIDESTTTGEAFEIISDLAEQNIVEWINSLDTCNPEPQSSDFSLSPKISKDEAEIKSTMTIKEVQRKIKGLNPFPGAFMMIDDKRVKLFDYSNEEGKNLIKIDLADGSLFINEYQMPGKKKIKL